MNQRLVWRIRQGTAAGFVGGLLLIGFGLVGQVASLPLALLLVVVGVVGLALRHHLYGLVNSDTLEAYLTAAPAAPLIAGTIMGFFNGATPGELQTLGGIVGLLALLNHLLRPLYGLVYHLLTRLSKGLA